MKNLLADFKKFILRGNVLDLAVAVVVGAAFTAVVTSFANDVLMGFVGALFGKPNFNRVVIHVGEGNVYDRKVHHDPGQLRHHRDRGVPGRQDIRDASEAARIRAGPRAGATDARRGIAH